MDLKLLFHRLSYLQYPLLVGVVYFSFLSWTSDGIDFGQTNKMLIFMGIAISFSTLQDTEKTSLKFEQKIWQILSMGKYLY